MLYERDLPMDEGAPTVVFAGSDMDARIAWSRLCAYGFAATLLDQPAETRYFAPCGPTAVKVAVPAREAQEALMLMKGNEDDVEGSVDVV